MDRKKRVGQACSVCKLSLILWLCFCVDANIIFAEASRIKDLINIKGNRTNELMGFGLVVGLNGTGDSPASVSTSKAMQSLLSRLGSEVQQDQLLTQSLLLLSSRQIYQLFLELETVLT
jgi:flagellar P-ring protein precursor FlgI